MVELDQDYAFETNLGGNSIAIELNRAIEQRVKVSVFYCGLASPERNIARVAARVAKGGHDMPEEKIRYRWVNSVHNLMALIPGCHAIPVFDNSADLVDEKPAPVLLFSLVEGVFASMPVKEMPEWAKPSVEAMKRYLTTSKVTS